MLVVPRCCSSMQRANNALLTTEVKGQSLQNWHQTGTSLFQKTKKSAGANLLTLVFLGSPTWARTRDLRINSRFFGIFRDFLGFLGTP